MEIHPLNNKFLCVLADDYGITVTLSCNSYIDWANPTLFNPVFANYLPNFSDVSTVTTVSKNLEAGVFKVVTSGQAFYKDTMEFKTEFTPDDGGAKVRAWPGPHNTVVRTVCHAQIFAMFDARMARTMLDVMTDITFARLCRNGSLFDGFDEVLGGLKVTMAGIDEGRVVWVELATGKKYFAVTNNKQVRTVHAYPTCRILTHVLTGGRRRRARQTIQRQQPKNQRRQPDSGHGRAYTRKGTTADIPFAAPCRLTTVTAGGQADQQGDDARLASRVVLVQAQCADAVDVNPAQDVRTPAAQQCACPGRQRRR